MADGLGLLVDETNAIRRLHQQALDSLVSVPVTFGAGEDVEPRWVPPLAVESQGSTNSCAGHAIALAASHANFATTGEVLRFSRRFGYITSQEIGGFLGRDQGTSITSTLAAATERGCCLESTCPFQERYDSQLPKQAYDEAAHHKHHGDKRYDCRDWETAIHWLTDHRCIVIGTRWYSSQDQCSGIEDKRVGLSGAFRGYHARLCSGWETHAGQICPVVQNSHGQRWGNHGRAIITRELWDCWRTDANFFALGFNRVDEVEPQRKSWLESKPGDSC